MTDKTSRTRPLCLRRHATEGLLDVLNDRSAPAAARVAAARAFLELDSGKRVRDSRAPVALRIVEKAVRINWANSGA